ncbi:hypothetical protein RDABS01_030070 [Bienertia sinuspersici]
MKCTLKTSLVVGLVAFSQAQLLGLLFLE